MNITVECIIFIFKLIIIVFILYLLWSNIKSKYLLPNEKICKDNSELQNVMKLIYVDDESILNYLIFKNKGIKKSGLNSNNQLKEEDMLEIRVNLLNRLKFLFNSKIERTSIQSSYTKVETQNINMFMEKENIEKFKKFESVTLYDIKNSFTSYKFAMPFVETMKDDAIKDVNIEKISALFDNCEGYHVFEAHDGDGKIFLRFNSSCFKSNYKRMEIIRTPMTVYALEIGTATASSFDFMQEVEKITASLSDGDIYRDIYRDDIETTPEEKSHRIYDVYLAYVGDKND